MTLTPTFDPKHDELFRKALENPKVAQEFFNTHLPKEIKNIIDTKTLVLQNCSFIEQPLKYRPCLLSAQLQDNTNLSL